MAIFYTSQAVKRNGPQYLKDNVTTAYLCIAPAKGDNIAAIQGKAIAQVALPGTDVTLTDSGNDLLVNINGKSGIDPSGTATSGQDIGVVYCSATENLLCIDATDRDLTNETGDTIDIPAAQYTVPELVAA